MKETRLSLSLSELLVIVAIAATLFVNCRWMDLDAWIGTAVALYLTVSLVLLLLGRGQ